MVGGQCMCITTCLSIHVHLNPWHSGWWSVYVHHYLFINSRTFKTLTQWLVVSVCVSLLVYQFTYIENLDTVDGGQCMCITTCLSIHVHLKPWHSGWWSVYVYHYLFIYWRTFKPLTQWLVVSVSIDAYLNPCVSPLTQWLVVSVCVSLLVYQLSYI